MLSRIWNRRRPASALAHRARPGLEILEDRAVPAAHGFRQRIVAALERELAFAPPARSAPAVVYVETNNPTDGQNAVLAFRRNPRDGGLTEIGSFATGGTGELNLPKAIGPDDGDQQVVASHDGRFLFAVNEGSNSVSAFRIHHDGRLTLVGAFDSGGVQPDSIGISDGRVYVANRGDATSSHPGTIAPNVTGFDVGDDGSLSAIPGSTVTFPVGTFATQALTTRNGRLLFVNLASLSGAAQGNTLVPFLIQPDGTLQLAPGGNVGASANPAVQLGLAFHPDLNILYAGLTGTSQLGVYTFDETGRTSFVTAVPNQGKAPCWVTVSADGRFLYTGDTGTDSVGVYSLADPLHPVEIQEFSLGGPHIGPGGTVQTADFELALDPGGRTLQVIGQSTSPTGSFPQGNQLHVLSVARDGTLSEPNGPIVFSTADVPGNAHPQGIAIVARPGGRGEGDDR
jgi:6-phosphogluconolactonase (cycloisomerase 2 family)